ncbi:hypothetical protein HKD37_03G007075 [Glycine soja]
MNMASLGLHTAHVCRQFHHPPPLPSLASHNDQHQSVLLPRLLAQYLSFQLFVVYKSKDETKDIELVEEEEARIGVDSSSATSNKSENYKEEARNAAQKHKAKRVESVNADAEAFAKALEHIKKRDTCHQSVSLENKTGDSTVLKIGDSAKVVIKLDMKGRRHKYGFNNNKREKPEKVRVVDDETGDKHQLDEVLRMKSTCMSYRMSRHHASEHADYIWESWIRSLSTRPPSAERPVVHVDPATGKANGPHRKKLRTYLGIVAHDKVDITYENWKEAPTAQKDLIWEDIQAEFDILEASDSRTKRKLLQTVDLTRKWALAVDQDGVEDTVYEKYGISKEKWAQFCQTRRHPSWEASQKQKLLAEKTKKELEEAAQSGSVDGFIDPPSPVRRHVKWKMSCTKKTGEMTTETAKEIAEKIDSFNEQATQGSFVPHGRQDVLTAAIGRPEHPGRVRAARAGVTIKQYFGSAPRTSCSSSSLPPKELQQLTQQIRDKLEESITEKVTWQLMASFSQMQSQMQSQGLALPPDPLVGPFGPRVSTKGSCVDPSGNDPETEADPACLVAMGRVYEGSTVVHNTPLLPGLVKVSVEEVTDADALVLVPTDEVSLVGQALHTFLAWPTHLVRWDATVFGVFNPDFPLYIKHEDLSKITHGAGNSDIYGFLEPQSIQRSGQSQFESESYIKTWMQSSKRDVYLGAYLNGGHWQMVVILPKEHLVVWFCSLHNRPDNCLKGIINSALKGLDDAPQPKLKAPARWIVVKYFNDPRPLETERLKALRIQWAQFYLRVRDQT